MSKNRKANNAMPKGKKAKGKNVPKTAPRAESIAVVQKAGPRIPRTTQMGNGTVVTHTETYGVNVTGSDPFNVFATWAVQPGIKSFSRGSPLGQWLPEIAQNFDNYEIEHLRFKFRTACSTLTTGLAVFGYEPNPEGTIPTTYQEMRNMYSVDGSVHANLTFDVSPKVRRKLLIRKTAVVNLPSYDAGKVYFGTIGVTGNALIGFVDVEYRVRLMNPQSSVTSSELVPLNNQLPFPTQRWVWDGASMPAVDCAVNCFEQCERFIGQATFSGAPLITRTVRSVTSQATTIDSGIFTAPGFGGNVFVASVGGRYRIRYSPRWDWQDLKMFAVVPFSSSSASGTMTRCQYQVLDSVTSGSYTTLPCNVYAHRGFTGTVTGDPNPGTDVWPTFEWEVLLNAGDDLLIGVGNLSYNSVSTAATVTGRAGLGVTEVVFTYLGSALA